MSHVLALLMQHGYAVVFGVILLENLGLPLPGLALLVVAGALAGAGQLGVPLIILAGIAGALLGDLVWYALGRWRGRPVLGFLCRLSLNPDTCVGNTERFFLRHGLPTLLVAKFLPGVNTIAPPLMGTLRAGVGRFLAFDTGGAVIFTVTTVGTGYFLGWEMVDRAQAAVSELGVWAGWGFGAFALAYVGWRLAVRLRVRKALRTVGLGPDELRRRQEAGEGVVVLDVRSLLAVGEKPRRIPGALRAGLDELEGIVGTLPADRPIVTYCV
jgi:membrane protein DedA with SNARE-associated domain